MSDTTEQTGTIEMPAVSAVAATTETPMATSKKSERKTGKGKKGDVMTSAPVEKAAIAIAEPAVAVAPEPPKPSKPYATLTKAEIGTLRVVNLADCAQAPYDSRVKPGVIDERFKSSLKTKGQDYPALAAQFEDGTYEIWDGRRRFNALSELGEKTIKIILIEPPKDGNDPKEMRRLKLLAFRTNHDRQELNGFETVMQIEEMAAEGFKNAEIAREIDVSEAYVSQIRSVFKSPEITAALKNGDLGESAVNKARAIAKVKDADVQAVLTNAARNFNMTGFQSIVSGYEAATDGTLKIDPRVVELVSRGALEPKTVERLKSLAKLRNYEQQYEMAKILAQRTDRAMRITNAEEREKAIPSIDELNDWITTLKRAAAGITEDETDTDEGAKFTFKPLSPTRVTETFESWSEKYKNVKKDPDADPVKVAEMRGVLKGIKLAGGYEKA